MPKVIVNGGVGFIGHQICLNFRTRGFEVYAIDNMKQLRFHEETKYYQKFIEERLSLLNQADVNIIEMDMSNSEKYNSLINEIKPDIVYHMSAIASAAICRNNPQKAFTENMVNVERALESVRLLDQGTRFVFASSSVAYGNFESEAVTEDSTLSPINIYGLLKKQCEELVRLYSKNYNFPHTIIRPSALYGPRCVNRRVSQLIIENALESKPVLLFGNGSEKLDFTFVDDTVQGFVKAGLEEGGINETFNITFGSSRPVKDLVKILTGYFPNLVIENRERDNTMPERGTLIVDKARKLIDYQPEYPIDVAYPKYIEWYLDRKEWIVQ